MAISNFERHSHSIPDIIIHSRLWEREWKITFPNFGNGNGNGKLHSQLLGTGTGMKKSFPNFGNGNGRPVLPGMVGNSRSPLINKTSQELRMLSSVTTNCQVTKIVRNPGSQLSVL